jgi:hypothetical protein
MIALDSVASTLSARLANVWPLMWFMTRGNCSVFIKGCGWYLLQDGYDILCNNQGASFATASCTNHLQEFLPPQVITHFKPVLVHAALKHIP